MKILAVDTSANIATVAITENDRLLAEYYLHHGKTHSQTLMPMIQDVMSRLELNPEEMDLFAASVGPGSFTGLRIGVTTVKALAYSMKKPVVGVPTLDALAYNIQSKDSWICPMMDARNRQVFTAVYQWRKEYPIRSTEYVGIPVEEVVSLLKAKEGKVTFLGDGAELHREFLLKELGEQCQFPNYNLFHQRAASVAQLAFIKHEKGQGEDSFDMLPFYLRKSQAERELEKRNE